MASGSKKRFINLSWIVVILLIFLIPLFSTFQDNGIRINTKVHAQTPIPAHGNDWYMVHHEPESNAWFMAGANPQRTSWVPSTPENQTEIEGSLSPVWYRPIEPYISQNVQIITSEGKLFISTARGLYCLRALDGEVLWVYPTELPLGHSPTVVNGVAYVGGFDRKLHAIDIRVDPSTLPTSPDGTRIHSQPLWTFGDINGNGLIDGDEPKAGFRTNPLVVEDLVLLGNRDGYFYAIYSQDSTTHPPGTLAWRFKTDGPILYSAAYKKDSQGRDVIYFASQDMHGYALQAQIGQPYWNVPGTEDYNPNNPPGASEKLHGAGFNSWWPVIWSKQSNKWGWLPEDELDKVIFTTGPNYRNAHDPGAASMTPDAPPSTYYIYIESSEIWPYPYTEGNEPGDWIPGTKTYDASPASQYFEKYPWRRSHILLDSQTGADWGLDNDGDGKLEYAPIAFTGTHNGIHAPAMISGFDNVFYQQNHYTTDRYGSPILGWKIGTPFINRITPGEGAAYDEPRIASGGGSFVYVSFMDRGAGAIDISQPLGSPTPREWTYYEYNLGGLCPGFDEVWQTEAENRADGAHWHQYYDGRYRSPNGIYGNHGHDQSPLVPYQGHIYMLKLNSVFSFGPEGGAQKLPLIESQDNPKETYSSFTETELKQMLVDEIEKWVDAGHLQPGWFNGAQFQGPLNDYYQNPAENIWVLIRALPYLPNSTADNYLRDRTKNFIQQEFKDYDPTQYQMTGWANGTTRDWFIYPPEVQADFKNFGPSTQTQQFTGIVWWNSLPPINYYALWKYAEMMDNPTLTLEIYNKVKDKIYANYEKTRVYSPNDAEKRNFPYSVNAYIAGYMGYLELEKMAKQPETAIVRNALNDLLQFRIDNFSKDSPLSVGYERYIAVSRNFIYLTPELGKYLHENAYHKVQEAVDEYNYVAPHWFVSRYESYWGEGTINQLNDYYALFQAKAWILKEPQEELVKYLDVPGFMRGDLFYIHNLISSIEARDTDITPPTQVQGLVAQAVSESQIGLSWQAASEPETWISYYNIYRDGNLINTSTSLDYSDTDLSSETTYTYQVSAVNPDNLEGLKSALVEARTPKDTNPPLIVSVTAQEYTKVQISFNERIKQTTAEEKTNYRIDQGISILAAALTEQKTVSLTTSLLFDGTTYTLTVNNIQDLSSNPVAPDTQATFTFESGLVGHWKFDEGSGDITYDSSIFGNNATIYGGATWTTGHDQGALSFDGVDDYVDIGAYDSVEATYTVMLWFNVSSSSNPATILHRGDSDQCFYNPRVDVNTSSVTVAESGCSGSGVLGSHSIDPDSWYHLAVTREDQTAIFYLNGEKIILDTSQPVPWGGAARFIIGGRYSESQGGASGGFNGMIDDLRVYNRALSTEEIVLLYSGRVPLSGDVDCDDDVDFDDAIIILNNWRTPLDQRADVNRDGKVNGIDIRGVMTNFGTRR